MDTPGEREETAEEKNRAARSPGYEERLAHFIALLEDDDVSSRWRAAETLGRIGDPAATGNLIDALWDEDPRVRTKAVWALGRIGDDRAIPPLRRLYRMESEEAREDISDAIAVIGRRRAGTGPGDFPER
ncbi:HEAT repeat domain-containing protein [Methanoregula sp.]|uniref:HEAT repeat domain-containing protein n=1 Tax=Methanoregula sp. TaxID=2052170 RepID=UPI000CB17566|nr:HEAT repeat domain-containing protein [Methanoregula sp.]PKG33406.1 MAG: HEAT repeat domain-containing protein [Methanoregula sp.]